LSRSAESFLSPPQAQIAAEHAKIIIAPFNLFILFLLGSDAV
jgi:hypothetical protein